MVVGWLVGALLVGIWLLYGSWMVGWYMVGALLVGIWLLYDCCIGVW